MAGEEPIVNLCVMDSPYALRASSKRSFTPKNYVEFRYEGYEVQTGSEVVTSRFSLVGAHSDPITFSETVVLPAPVRDAEEVRPVVRLLALAMGLSYYKAAAPRRITVSQGMTAMERTFLIELVGNGMGEFAYRNGRPLALTPEIVAEPINPIRTTGTVRGTRPLVAVGGGKDSAVTIEVCKHVDGVEPPLLFSVNQYPAVDRCVAVSGCEYVAATRQIDPLLLELNKAGALNGHVPVTAINSLIGLLVSHVMGAGPVVMSNEASANFGNVEWVGREINHQWSKSLDFENLLRRTLAESGFDASAYFSLLRPFDELHIAQRFSRLPQYFLAFTSCNKAFKLDQEVRATHWCCDCPKCLFVFLSLAAWLPPQTVVPIFGQNLLDDPRHLDSLREILGLTGYKPFECVGEESEAREALRLAGARKQWADTACVRQLLPQIADFPPYVPVQGVWDNIPDPYAAALARTQP